MQDSIAKLVASIACALRECDEEAKSDVEEMSKVVADESSTEDEKKQAALTIYYILFPRGSLDMADPQNFLVSRDAKAVQRGLNEEAVSFSRNLARVMKDKGKTQVDLASQLGIGQSAIANMVSRECRPQHRTIVKLAKVLGVKPKDLWPGSK